MHSSTPIDHAFVSTQEKKPSKKAVMRKSSLQRKVPVDNVPNPTHKKRTTTVTRPFKFHKTRRRSRSAAAHRAHVPSGGKTNTAASKYAQAALLIQSICISV